MPIKEEKHKYGEVEVTIHEISFQDEVDLENDRKKAITNETEVDPMMIYWKCVNEKDVLKKLTSKEGLDLVQKINKINGWEKKDDDPQQEPHTTDESGK